MPDLYPEVEPYAQGVLEVTGGDLVCCRIPMRRFVNGLLLPGAYGSPRHRIGLPCLDWQRGSVIRRSPWPMRGWSRITFVTMGGLAMEVSCVMWIG